jgi:YesN/AraC family two-component response regulator
MNEEKAGKLGIAAYAVKPLVKKDLVSTVRKVLDDAKNKSND